MYIVLDLGCGRGVLIWKLMNRSLEVFLNVFIRFCKFGKVRKTEETLADFPEKNLSVGKEKKKKFFF